MFKHFILLFSVFCLTQNELTAQGVKLGHSIVGSQLQCSFISFSPNDSIVVSGRFDGKIEKWNVIDEKLKQQQKPFNQAIDRIIFDPTGDFFYVSAKTNWIKKYHLKSFTCVDSFSFNQPIFHIQALNSNSFYASLEDGSLYKQDKKQQELLFKTEFPVVELFERKGGEELVFSDGKSIQILHLASQHLQKTMSQNSGAWIKKILPYKSSEDTVITVTDRGEIQYWDLEDERLIKHIYAKNPFYNQSSTQNSNHLISGFYKDKSLLFSLSDYELSFDQEDDIRLSNILQTSPSRQFMITADHLGRHQLLILIGEPKIKPLAFQKREIKGEFLAVQDSVLYIEVWDHEEIDKDRVSLYYNQDWLCRNLTLAAERKRFKVHLEPGENTLVFHAENLGDLPPNTCALLIIFPKKRPIQRIMRSDLKESASLTFVRN